jgi:hypothetical protein
MKNESSARVMLGNLLGPAITTRAWCTYMVWLVDSLSIGRLLVTADVASVCALFVANLAVALADFASSEAIVQGWVPSQQLRSSSIHGLSCRSLSYALYA